MALQLAGNGFCKVVKNNDHTMKHGNINYHANADYKTNPAGMLSLQQQYPTNLNKSKK